MKIKDIVAILETTAPLSLQEEYDNAGLITGQAGWDCTGVVVALDATEAVIEDAIARNANMVIAHHPIVFKGLKKINGYNYVEKALITAIKKDIAIYAIHTNLDNIIQGVNGRMADKLGLINRQILVPKKGILKKIQTYVPVSHIENVREALFNAGAGSIGAYSDCSFSSMGTGSFKGGEATKPFVGQPGKRHYEEEQKLEMIFEGWKERQIMEALYSSHPYEELAYDIITLDNRLQSIGAGIIAELPEAMDASAFFDLLKSAFGLKIIRHSPFLSKKLTKIAICGGSGSFLTSSAIAAGADIFVTADIKYHEFFDANGQLILADIGHYESEQYTQDLICDVLQQKFPTFAIQKTVVQTNPVQYWG